MEYNQAFYEATGYKISTLPSTHNKPENLPQKVEDFVESFFRKHPNRQKQEITTLIKYTREYPTYLEAYMSLYVYYARSEKENARMELFAQIKNLFPDHIWIVAEEAHMAIMKKDNQTALKILGEELSLKTLRPDTEIFAEKDYLEYYFMVTSLHLANDMPAKAKRVLWNMIRLNPAHEVTQNTARLIISHNRNSFLLKGTGYLENEHIKHVEAKDTATIQPPAETVAYHHPREMGLLEEYTLSNIPTDIIEQILALPKDTLQKDLEQLFLYASYRDIKEFEDSLVEDIDYEDMPFYDLPFHALIFLASIDAKDSLPLILDTLRRNNGALEALYGNSLEHLLETIYALGESQLPLLVAFAKLRYIDNFPKELIYKAITQVALHQPERREEVIAHLLDLANEFLENQTDEGLIDTFGCSMLFPSFSDLKAKEALPTLRQMYEAKLYETDFMGDWESIELEFEGEISNKAVFTLPENIFERYEGSYQEREFTAYSDAPTVDGYIAQIGMEQVFGANFHNFLQDFDFGQFDNDNFEIVKKDKSFHNLGAPIDVGKKIAPNDPCPCGSGKKYKKCCRDKA